MPDDKINHITCENCGHGSSKVTETRRIDNDDLIVSQRRRQCNKCAHKWFTYEVCREYIKAVIDGVGLRQ